MSSSGPAIEVSSTFWTSRCAASASCDRLRRGESLLVQRVQRPVHGLEEPDRLLRGLDAVLAERELVELPDPSQLFLRSVWKNSNVSTRCTEPTTMSSSQPRKLSLTSIANSRPWSMHSCAASAGVSSPYSEWPKSSRMPRLSRPTCWMPSRVRAAFGKMILFRGSRGLYSITNLISGCAPTSSRSPSTARFQMSW